jgi:hypothetical protein
MKDWIELYKLIRRFGVKLVCNAASDLKPRETEGVAEYKDRLHRRSLIRR